MAEIEELADELYLLPPAEFVAARSAVAATARAAGDRATATAVAALRKPTVTAWLTNRVVRTQPDLLAGIVALGPALRDATVAGDRDALRDLGRHRQLLLAEVVTAARSIADDADQAFTATTQRELEATFTAAASDPAAADELATGRLTAALSVAGLGFELGAIPPATAFSPRPSTSVGGAAARTVTTTPAPPAGPADDQAVVDAEQALATARLHDADASGALADARSALQEAQAAEKRAAAAYQEAKQALSDARADVTAATADAARTSKAVETALARVGRARKN